MVMELIQVRLPEKIIEDINNFVEEGYYSSKSDVIRDALRKLLLEKHIGSIPNSGDSVQEVRAIRKKLSKEPFNLEKINRL